MRSDYERFWQVYFNELDHLTFADLGDVPIAWLKARRLTCFECLDGVLFLFDVGDYALDCRREDRVVESVFRRLIAPLAVDCPAFPAEGSYGPIHASEFDSNRDRTFEIHLYVNRLVWMPRLTRRFSETLAVEQAETDYRNVESPSLQWAPVANSPQKTAMRHDLRDCVRVH